MKAFFSNEIVAFVSNVAYVECGSQKAVQCGPQRSGSLEAYFSMIYVPLLHSRDHVNNF